MKFLNPPAKVFLKQSTRAFKYSFILWAIFLLGSISSFKSTSPMPFYILVYNWTVWLYPVICGSLLGLAHYTYRQHNHEDTVKQLWLLAVVATPMLGYASMVSLFPMIIMLVIPFALVFRRIPKVVFAEPGIFAAIADMQHKVLVARHRILVPRPVRKRLPEPQPS